MLQNESLPPTGGYLDTLSTLDMRDEEVVVAAVTGLVEPLFPVPPEDQWGSVEIPTDDGSEALPVPFTELELSAIEPARKARAAILHQAAYGSGLAREYNGGPLFPSSPQALLNRPKALWGLFVAARYAIGLVETYKETAWAATGEERAWFAEIRDLPDVLLAGRGKET